MKAVTWKRYGAPEVLQLEDVAKPSPKKNEVQIKVHASSVTTADCRLRALNVPHGFKFISRLVFGFNKPKKSIIGMEFSGEAVAIGSNVSAFQPGDLVYGTTGMQLGANAQYVCVTENSAIVKKPNNFSHEQTVATIFGGLTAIHFLKDQITLNKGQKILINGASGAVGTAAIQLAKYYGAEITAVCSTSNIELVTSLGANIVIDYTQEDFTSDRFSQAVTKYDVILDTVGNLSLAQCKSKFTTKGKLVLINTDLATELSSVIHSQLICGVARETKAALSFLRQLIESGNFQAVIDKVYSLEQTAQAHSYVDQGRKKGNVVIAISHNKNSSNSKT